MSETKDKQQATTATPKGEKLVPVTVRFTPAAYQAINEIAGEQGYSMADIVRMAVDDRLLSYLDAVHYIDAEQGAEIKKIVTALYNEMSAVKLELRRIGVNYNQVARLENLKKKYPRMIDRMEKELAIRKECKDFSPDDLAELMTRYEKATAEAGEKLCHILG